MVKKLSAELQAQVQSHAESDVLEVIVELRPEQTVPGEQTGSRAERIEHRKQAFDSSASPVQSAIEALGGQVTGRAWINCSMRAKVPVKALESLAEVERVGMVDVPRAIEPDFG